MVKSIAPEPRHDNVSLNTFSGRRASQNKFEIESFAALLRSYDVRSLLEIGSREGDTFHFLMTSLPPGSRGVAVDLPGGLWGKSSTRKKLDRAVADLKTRGYQVSTLFGDSTTTAVQNLARMRGPYDAILIDGSHTYEGVSKDWLAYGSLAKIVAFHDIAGEGQAEKKCGQAVEVPRLWAEIKANADDFSTVEFIDEASRMGIGVVLKCA